ADRHGHERWRCWSGDEHHRGDAVDLILAIRGGGPIDAVDWLATRAGMIPDRPLPPLPPKATPIRPQIVPLDPAVVTYVDACERILWTGAGASVRDWLERRGLQPAVLRTNRVGADPGRRLLPRPVGLPRGDQPGAVFPALDPAGAVRYAQTRYLDPAGGPK